MLISSMLTSPNSLMLVKTSFNGDEFWSLTQSSLMVAFTFFWQVLFHLKRNGYEWFHLRGDFVLEENATNALHLFFLQRNLVVLVVEHWWWYIKLLINKALLPWFVFIILISPTWCCWVSSSCSFGCCVSCVYSSFSAGSLEETKIYQNRLFD